MRHVILITAMLFFAPGCMSSGPKYIDLAYTGDQPPKALVYRAGLTRFIDKRPHTPKGQVGFRVLLNNNRETFVVAGMDLAAAMTRITRTYMEHNGFTVAPYPVWPLTPKGVTTAPKEYTHLLAGEINTFECRAHKKGPTTDMVLAIDLTLYLGTPENSRLSTIPIALTLERTELTFSRKKVEHFINQALEEILKKALPLS